MLPAIFIPRQLFGLSKSLIIQYLNITTKIIKIYPLLSIGNKKYSIFFNNKLTAKRIIDNAIQKRLRSEAICKSGHENKSLRRIEIPGIIPVV